MARPVPLASAPPRALQGQCKRLARWAAGRALQPPALPLRALRRGCLPRRRSGRGAGAPPPPDTPPSAPDGRRPPSPPPSPPPPPYRKPASAAGCPRRAKVRCAAAAQAKGCSSCAALGGCWAERGGGSEGGACGGSERGDTHLLGYGRVETDKGLVEHDHPLALRQDLRERGAAQHPAAQLPRHLAAVGGGAQADLAQDLALRTRGEWARPWAEERRGRRFVSRCG